MKMYDLGIVFDIEKILVFLNGRVLFPSIDFILKDKGMCNGFSIGFKNELVNNDRVIVRANSEVYLYMYLNGDLIDFSNDVPKEKYGFENARDIYFKWLDVNKVKKGNENE